jgi:hypothetical protein
LLEAVKSDRHKGGGAFVSAYLATTLFGVTLPFVITTGAKRSGGTCGAPRLPHKGLGFVKAESWNSIYFQVKDYAKQPF